MVCVFLAALTAGTATGSWQAEGTPWLAAPAGGSEPDGSAGQAGGESDGNSDGNSDGRAATGDPAAATADGEPPAGDAALLVSRSGDRWAAAYTAEEYEELQLSLEGGYVGTGIALHRTPEGTIEISRVHSGSPAALAGVRAGDELLSIDGEPVGGVPVTEAVSRLRGSDQPGGARAGSTVRVALVRDGVRWQAELKRAVLETKPVTVDRDTAGVTRIRLESFTAGSADLVRAAVENAPESDGLLLDLRGNSGGLVTEAAAVASVFLDGGLVATYDVYGEQQALYAEPGGHITRPLVVLVDGGTMSSAELLTGALQDRNRAVVVGTPTFGKGTVQMPIEQPDGSVAELTVGHYATPSGEVVEDGEGIAPDVVVEDGEDAVARGRSVLEGLASGA
ncbi:S41 family peptidase [Streptomyces aidingensis]|uniref:Carboxyl-terminal processing protease n=1 Tax=Streptomyces aidingensis TaxID=910347 RepID=A0A1I1RB75_9ACTN|nr:S41 family peptidase [Streptomyces aidingensis]SFD31492.1 carboxyl-terminal processing protease [Streptomyces aidingensis]